MGAAPEFGPSQPRALKHRRPGLAASRLPAPIPTHSAGANKREVTLEEVSLLGRLAVTWRRLACSAPSGPHTPRRSDPPASRQLLPTGPGPPGTKVTTKGSRSRETAASPTSEALRHHPGSTATAVVNRSQPPSCWTTPWAFRRPNFCNLPRGGTQRRVPLPSPPPGRGWPPPAASRDVSFKETGGYLAGRAAPRKALRWNRGLSEPSWRMPSGQAPGRGVESRGVLGAGRSPLRRSRGAVSVAERESFSTSTASWPRDPPAPVPSLDALAAPSLLCLIGWSRYWRGLAAGARGSGLRVAPGWERGAPPLGQKESLPDAAGALGRSPWTLPNGTPVFQLADFLQSLMLVSHGPTGCCGICTKDPGGRGMRRRLGLTQPGSWLAQKPKPSSTHPPPRPPAAFPFEPPPSRTGSRLLAFPYLSAFPNTILKHFCCLTREGG